MRILNSPGRQGVFVRYDLFHDVQYFIISIFNIDIVKKGYSPVCLSSAVQMVYMQQIIGRYSFIHTGLLTETKAINTIYSLSIIHL